MHTTLLSVRAVKAVSRSMLKSSMPLKLASSAMVPLQKQQQADRPVLLWLQASSRLCSRLQQTSEGCAKGCVPPVRVLAMQHVENRRPKALQN